MKDEDLKLEEIEASERRGCKRCECYSTVIHTSMHQSHGRCHKMPGGVVGTGRVRTQKRYLGCHTHLYASVSRAFWGFYYKR